MQNDKQIQEKFNIEKLSNEKSSVTDNHMPRVHRKNEKWQPPRATGPIESCLSAFEDNMIQEARNRKHLKGSKLSALQKMG